MTPEAAPSGDPLPEGRGPAPGPSRALVLAAFLALAALYVGGSFVPVVWDETEGQYAGAAREMWLAGDWWVPTNDGIPRLNKPPLFYWTILGCYSVAGVTVFGARLANALSTLLWLLAVYGIGCEAGGRRVGLRAACVLGTTLGAFIFCHLIAPEPLFAALLSLAFWTLLRALCDPSRARRWILGTWLCMALASLTKGLHGAAYPLAVAGATAILRPAARPVLRKLLRWPGPVAFLLILLPWYAYIEIRFPGFLSDHLLNEQVGHVFNQRWPPDSSQVALLPFLLEHLVLFFPWIVFVPSILRARRQGGRASGAADRGLRAMLWLWPTLTLVSVLFSARQDYYTMTCWGALAVLFALSLDRLADLSPRLRVTPLLVLLALGVLLIAGSWVLGAAPGSSPAGAVPAAERPHAWETLRGFSAGTWARITGPMLWAGVALLASALASALLARQQRIELSMAAVAGGMVGLLAVVPWGFSIVQDYLSLAPAAEVIQRAGPPGAWVVYDGEPHRAASLFFYLDRPVHWVDSLARDEFAPRVHGIGRDLFLGREQLADLWRSGRPLYLITEEVRVPEWRRVLGLDRDASIPIARSGTRVVLASRRR